MQSYRHTTDKQKYVQGRFLCGKGGPRKSRLDMNQIKESQNRAKTEDTTSKPA